MSARIGSLGFAVSHPFARKKANGWGTVHYSGFGDRHYLFATANHAVAIHGSAFSLVRSAAQIILDH